MLSYPNLKVSCGLKWINNVVGQYFYCETKRIKKLPFDWSQIYNPPTTAHLSHNKIFPKYIFQLKWVTVCQHEYYLGKRNVNTNNIKLWREWMHEQVFSNHSKKQNFYYGVNWRHCSSVAAFLTTAFIPEKRRRLKSSIKWAEATIT